MTNLRVLQKLAITVALMLSLLAVNRVTSGQTLSDMLDTLQNLPEDQQNLILDQIAQQISNTTTSTSDEETSGIGSDDEDTGLPNGQGAIAYALEWNPGRQVRAAASGTPILAGKMFEQPVDGPDFWDRVKEVFLEGLLAAITDTFGISLTGL